MAELRSHIVARAAYEVVDRRRSEGNKMAKAYGALAHKLPGLILQSGLAQSTGFLLAKARVDDQGTTIAARAADDRQLERGAGAADGNEHRALLEDLAALLRRTGTTRAVDGRALHAEVIEADLQRTILLTRRALEASAWLKRYVQGALGVDATGESNGDVPPHNT